MPQRKKDEKNQCCPRLAPLAVLLCGILAYCNSFTGPFIYDDLDSIRYNPDFNGRASPHEYSPHLEGGPPSSTTLTSRPILWATFWLNAAVAGHDSQGILNVPIFHATNLLIHLANALLLYGIVRRNLSRKQTWGNRFESSAPWLAAIVAALWVTHPLSTESVTYIVQRAESLAGFFYLSVIYCLIRSADRPGISIWHFAAIVSCFLGAVTKEILVTAPVIAFLYDRTFLAGSFLSALRSRWQLYASLAATWPVMGFLIYLGGGRGHSVSFSTDITAVDYAYTQLGAIAHYLRLTIWPTGLTLSLVDWPITRHWTDIHLPGYFVLALMVLTLFALWKTPRLGFLGAWFFGILAPSSSFIPIITEIVSEHRTYLPLAAPITLAVVVGWMLAQKYHAIPLAAAAAGVVLVALITLTIQRNTLYSTAVGIWTDNVESRPDNAQAQYDLGYAWAEIDWSAPRGSAAKRFAAANAAEHIRRAFELDPAVEIAQLLGHLIIESGDPIAAEKHYDMAIAKFPELAFEARMERGQLRGQRGDFAGAKSDFEAAILADPDSPEAHFLLGVVDEKLNDPASAQQEFQRALELKPGYPDALRELHRLNPTGQN